MIPATDIERDCRVLAQKMPERRRLYHRIHIQQQRKKAGEAVDEVQLLRDWKRARELDERVKKAMQKIHRRLARFYDSEGLSERWAKEQSEKAVAEPTERPLAERTQRLHRQRARELLGQTQPISTSPVPLEEPQSP